ncbi:MAG: hypothetical protein H0V17_00880 [Deltaproteobacteria bacterium]|nr:hypothetical protein [Deltaproteobacteria bacterium]
MKWLLAQGADVNAKAHGESVLEVTLSSMTNADLEDRAPVVKALIMAGAKITPAARKAVQVAYSAFDYHREAMAPAFRKKGEAAAVALCTFLGVEPPKPRIMHDGKSAIAVPKGTVAKQFETLWNLLVPSSGAAKTAQGEVVRIAGRINLELSRNGGMNWDAQYRKMAKAFARRIASGTPVDDELLAEASTSIASIIKSPRQDHVQELCRIAIAWVRANPKPIKCGPVDYDR